MKRSGVVGDEGGEKTVVALWERVRLGGDRAAFTALVIRYQRANRALAETITGNEEDGEDVVQEAWLAAWAAREEIADIGGWLRRAIRGLAINARRNRRNRGIVASYPYLGEDGEVFEEAERVEVPVESVALQFIEAHPCWEDRMNAWIIRFGRELLSEEDYRIGYALYCSHPARSRGEIAADLRITKSKVNAAAVRIRRIWEASVPTEDAAHG